MENQPGKNRFEKHPIITLLLKFLLFLLMVEIPMKRRRCIVECAEDKERSGPGETMIRGVVRMAIK